MIKGTNGTMKDNDLEKTAPGAQRERRAVTRKDFLKVGGGAVGAASLLGLMMSPSADAETSKLAKAANRAATPRTQTASINGQATLTTANVQDYGASGSDFQTSGSIAAGSKQLSVKSAGDFAVGQGIYIAGAGKAGAALVTTVTAVGKGANVITLKDAAGSAASNATVQHDDTAAIMKAFNALGTPPQGRLGFPQGLYRISSTLEFGLGETSAPGFPSGSWFELQMVGRLCPVPGIGRAVYVHDGFSMPLLEVKIDHGGSDSDDGLVLENVHGAQVYVYAEGFAGTVVHILGHWLTSAVTGTVVNLSSIQKLYAFNCGRALLFEGVYGFGLIEDVWDSQSAHGSLFLHANDVTICHWENVATTQEVSLEFQNCGATHLGVIALGDLSPVMMRIQNCHGFSMDKYFGLCPNNTTGTSLEIIDSVVSIANALTWNGLNGIYVKGSSVSINNHEGFAGDNHLRIGTSPNSTEAQVNVQALYGRTAANPTDGSGTVPGSTHEDIVIDPDVTGGYLQLGGSTANTNSSGDPGQYAVHCHSAAFDIYTWGFKQKQSNVAGGIGHPHPDGHVILGGGKIDDGVVTTT